MDGLAASYQLGFNFSEHSSVIVLVCSVEERYIHHSTNKDSAFRFRT